MEQSVLDAIGSAKAALHEAESVYKKGDLILYHECMTAALADVSEALSLSSGEIMESMKFGNDATPENVPYAGEGENLSQKDKKLLGRIFES